MVETSVFVILQWWEGEMWTGQERPSPKWGGPSLKGIYTPAGSLTSSNSGLPDHHSPTLWHWMLIILILLIHVTTIQQWNTSWQSKRRRNGTNSEHSHCGCRPRNSWVTRNDRVHEGQWKGRDSTRRVSLPCARVKTVKHSKLHIRFSDAHLNTKTVDGYSGYIILP